MDTRSGHIDEYSKIDQSHRTRLRDDEAEHLAHFPSDMRPCELALFRFCKDRKALKAEVTSSIRNSFRMGYMAALADQKGNGQKDG